MGLSERKGGSLALFQHKASTGYIRAVDSKCPVELQHTHQLHPRGANNPSKQAKSQAAPPFHPPCRNRTMTRILLLLLSTALTCHGFSALPSRTAVVSSSRSITELAAQKMTPTRKTRRDDSFDRSSGDEEKEEANGEFKRVLLVLCATAILASEYNKLRVSKVASYVNLGQTTATCNHFHLALRCA